ncbi:hypothetical protein Tco_0888352 [Tanacetum coccineum]
MGRLLVDVIEGSRMRLVENIDECNVFPCGSTYGGICTTSFSTWLSRSGLWSFVNKAFYGEIKNQMSYQGHWRGIEGEYLSDNNNIRAQKRLLSASQKRAKIATKDLPIIPRCDSSCLIKEIILKDNVITQLNTRIFKPEAIIQVLGRERNAGYRDNLDFRQYFVTLSEDIYANLKKEFIELTRLPLFGICPSMQDQNSDDDVIKGAAYAMAEKDRESNHLADQDMTQFLKDVKPWAEILLQDSIPVWYADESRYKVAWKDVDQVFMPINETDTHCCLA